MQLSLCGLSDLAKVEILKSYSISKEKKRGGGEPQSSPLFILLQWVAQMKKGRAKKGKGNFKNFWKKKNTMENVQSQTLGNGNNLSCNLVQKAV